VILYAETSAILTWILDEPQASEVTPYLRDAELILTSRLTLLECERALSRLAAQGAMPEAVAARERARLGTAAMHWDLMSIDELVVERAGRRFPVEPIRTLDALHLATALIAQAAVADIGLLSLDRRVRDCARSMGFTVRP
jgi:hypothetical protein